MAHSSCSTLYILHETSSSYSKYSIYKDSQSQPTFTMSWLWLWIFIVTVLPFLQEVRNATEIVGEEVSFADRCSIYCNTWSEVKKHTQRTFYSYDNRRSTKLHNLQSTARRSPTFARKSDRSHRKNKSYELWRRWIMRNVAKCDIIWPGRWLHMFR